MENPLISFVVPTKNRLEWIDSCLSSLVTQSYKDREIIVVDDGSEDGTKEHLDKYWAKRDCIKVIHNPKSVGGGASRNIGNEAAQGDIIAVCDDDDLYPYERAEKVAEFFKDRKYGDLMNPPYVQIGYFDEILERFDGEPFDYKRFINDGVVNYFCNPGSAFYKKDIMEIGGYPSETKEKTDDYQMIKNWVNAGKSIVYAPPDYLCMHRVLPESMMAKLRGFDEKWVSK